MSKQTKRKADFKIQIWVTQNEKSLIDQNAKASGLNRTKYLRRLLLNQKIKAIPPAIDREALLLIGKTSNNINQIARVVNSAKVNIFYRETKNKLIKELSSFKKILDNNADAIFSKIR